MPDLTEQLRSHSTRCGISGDLNKTEGGWGVSSKLKSTHQRGSSDRSLKYRLLIRGVNGSDITRFYPNPKNYLNYSIRIRMRDYPYPKNYNG